MVQKAMAVLLVIRSSCLQVIQDSNSEFDESDSLEMNSFIEHSYDVLFVPDAEVECITICDKKKIQVFETMNNFAKLSSIGRFSNECHKTKVITLATQKRRRQSSKPIKTRSYYT